MNLTLLATPYREPSQEEQELVQEIMRDLHDRMSGRCTFESHWEEIASLIDPSAVNTFTFGAVNTPGEKKSERQVDATGMMALSRFGAICDSLLTPRNMKWHTLSANDDYVMKDRATKLWFEDTTRRLFKYRYTPNANFSAQNQKVYKSIGAYGTGPLFIDKLASLTGEKGLRYRKLPVGQVYLRENHQGQIDGFIRWWQWQAHQVVQAFGIEWCPEKIRVAYQKNSSEKFTFVQHVAPRTDYDRERIDAKGKPYRSCVVSWDSKCLMEPESGYNSFPMPCARYEQNEDEIYGRSPAMLVLPALKTLNAEKRVFLKQGHRAADPVLLTSDDGLIDMSLRPGAMNKGGWSSEGKPLVGVLPTGDIQITKEMMQDERILINDAFLVTLFQILTESPQMTATEVIERTNEKGILLAPTVGAQQGGYLGPMVDRELDVLSEQGLLLPMPPRLREAEGEYQVIYTSPLAKAMRAQEAAGFVRSVETAISWVNVTQDPSLLDPFDFDTAVPEIAEIQGTPPSWMASEEKIKQKRDNRARVMAEQMKTQRMPAEAAMMKAEAQVEGPAK